MRIVRAKISWKDWFLLDFARYLYWLGVFSADVFVILWLVDELAWSRASEAAVAFLMLVALLAVEALTVTLIWPKKIIDSDDID